MSQEQQTIKTPAQELMSSIGTPKSNVIPKTLQQPIQAKTSQIPTKAKEEQAIQEVKTETKTEVNPQKEKVKKEKKKEQFTFNSKTFEALKYIPAGKKTKRIQFMIQPLVFEEIEKVAIEQGISANQFILNSVYEQMARLKK